MTVTLTLTLACDPDPNPDLTSESPPKAASAPKPDLHTPSKSAVAAMSEGRAMGLRKSGEDLSYPTPTLFLPYSYPRFPPPPNFKLTSSRSPYAHPGTAHFNASPLHPSCCLLSRPLQPSLHKACMQAQGLST